MICPLTYSYANGSGAGRAVEKKDQPLFQRLTGKLYDESDREMILYIPVVSTGSGVDGDLSS